MDSYRLIELFLNSVPSIITIITTSSVIKYRIDQLEKKVTVHNGVMDRVTILEIENRTLKDVIHNLENEIKEMRDKLYED